MIWHEEKNSVTKVLTSVEARFVVREVFRGFKPEALKKIAEYGKEFCLSGLISSRSPGSPAIDIKRYP